MACMCQYDCVVYSWLYKSLLSEVHIPVFRSIIVCCSRVDVNFHYYCIGLYFLDSLMKLITIPGKYIWKGYIHFYDSVGETGW